MPTGNPPGPNVLKHDVWISNVPFTLRTCCVFSPITVLERHPKNYIILSKDTARTTLAGKLQTSTHKNDNIQSCGHSAPRSWGVSFSLSMPFNYFSILEGRLNSTSTIFSKDLMPLRQLLIAPAPMVSLHCATNLAKPSLLGLATSDAYSSQKTNQRFRDLIYPSLLLGANAAQT